jgi:tRNA 5-methylaminomethyl-2-thiouridine biosynthesis bifunctional protein
MDAGARMDFLSSCGLPGEWAELPAWTVLDTAFGSGEKFLDTWRLWKSDPHRSCMLHYVAIARPDAPQFPDAPPEESEDSPFRHSLTLALASEQLNTRAGFHRLTFENGRVSFTLCVGDVQPALAEQDFVADTIFIGDGGGGGDWDKWALRQLARRCRRGTRFHAVQSTCGLPSLWEDAGFEFFCAPLRGVCGAFNPRWSMASSRKGGVYTPPAVTSCAVIGAGIAGATVAHALSLRGWKVRVFDSQPEVAGGASGLPAGLMVPHVSGDDSPRSRMSRSGNRLMIAHAKRLLDCGTDWELSGVMEHRRGTSAKGSNPSSLWHTHAGWIKPSMMVRALLGQPGIAFTGSTHVKSLERSDGFWLLRDGVGELGRFEIVVIANAVACTELVKDLQPALPVGHELLRNIKSLVPMHGTVTTARYGVDMRPADWDTMHALPQFPVNGNGSFLPRVPEGASYAWFAGATFEAAASKLWDVKGQHAANRRRLEQLLPEAASALCAAFDDGSDLRHWSGTRCVTHDRLPLVGEIRGASASGLWISTGMGSRGLSFSALCAEILVAQIGGEPLSIEVGLCRVLSVSRARRNRPQAPVGTTAITPCAEEPQFDAD